MGLLECYTEALTKHVENHVRKGTIKKMTRVDFERDFLEALLREFLGIRFTVTWIDALINSDTFDSLWLGFKMTHKLPDAAMQRYAVDHDYLMVNMPDEDIASPGNVIMPSIEGSDALTSAKRKVSSTKEGKKGKRGLTLKDSAGRMVKKALPSKTLGPELGSSKQSAYRVVKTAAMTPTPAQKKKAKVTTPHKVKGLGMNLKEIGGIREGNPAGRLGLTGLGAQVDGGSHVQGIAEQESESFGSEETLSEVWEMEDVKSDTSSGTEANADNVRSSSESEHSEPLSDWPPAGEYQLYSFGWTNRFPPYESGRSYGGGL